MIIFFSLFESLKNIRMIGNGVITKIYTQAMNTIDGNLR